ncbi:DUF1882 domain-containing protein [Helicobacter ailurogastricus]|uniref:DUF1882 domain-containing protein n=1 Tax=Helicobacter ailurogastricus TaxID=1578720 RepID=A0A0K2Y060_9HELI|nr:DUF1882 domain-containing protein [Helicobacter ailurogastricus]CRF41646.1 FIG00469546: hypothetical protein [Helicobacter ailurogastricus]CRF42638.1 FIG00469546: hypothetical protein [Helicobacter ailurogastricus]CRF44880.1 FIG00469546: hypothetical protein [Helicobacter ailurogastricus]CRF52711.1 hypothetical protein HAL07_11760 [Helicobacter ailurogastricus]BDQ28171.1 ABC transporter [Helicobacter ailurogastricus]
MVEMDLKLIKMQTGFYYSLKPGLGQRVTHMGRCYYDKFERVEAPLTSMLIQKHWKKEITIAHALVLPNNKVENIVFDYNGRNPERFYHKAQLLLREEGFINFTAYESKTPGHLHLYIHKGHTQLSEGQHLARTLSMKLAQSLPNEWRTFPNNDLPLYFNILVLPYRVYAKERGASWARHL